MKEFTRKEIDDFFNCRNIVVAGASRNQKSFSASAIAHLRQLGYQVFSVNPYFNKTDPEKLEYLSISDIPETELNLLVLTAPQHTSGIIEQAIVKGIKNIWIQQESETPAAIKLCEAASLKPIYNHCIFMFSKPTGIHHFHYGLKKFFGSMPK